MSTAKLFLVLSERYEDGKIMTVHEMRREVMIARFKDEYITTIEVDESFKRELCEVLDELE
jgi:hypothetical protein